MKRRSKARFEARSLRGSRHKKNPAQQRKLRDEKKQVKAVQDSPRPHCLAKQGEEKAANPYCECCCGAAGSHYRANCPYLRWLPWNVDTVGKGFVIMCQFCSAIGDDCRHQRKHAVRLACTRCGVEGHHVNGACSVKNGMEYGRKITLGRRPDPGLPGLWIGLSRSRPCELAQNASL
ncbi:hypothetical protein ACFX1T_010169 [Malus domestica]